MADEAPNTENELLSIADKTQPGFRWTVKKEKFCHHYARLGHVGKAEKAAGYSAENYGGTLLMMAPIRERVHREVRNLLRSQGENEDTVIARWSRWADADMGDYFETGWQLKDIHLLDDDARQCIKKVKITENQFGRNVDIELFDAPAANINLANMMGILAKDDGLGLTAEEQAKSIKQLLQEMNEANGLQEPTLESGTRGTSKVTH